MRIALFLTQGVSDAGLHLAQDAFAMANRLLPQLRAQIPPFTLELIGPGRTVVTQRGVRLTTLPASALCRPDVVYLPAPAVTAAADLAQHIQLRANTATYATLRRWSAEGTQVTAACAATFYLAAAGLLHGRKATTTWWLAQALRDLDFGAEVTEERMLVCDRNVVTAGAFMGHLDLALWLIRQQSPQLADLTARYLVATQSASQAPFIVPQYTQHPDPVVAKFERFTRDNLAQPLPMAQLAKRCGVSERSLHRHIHGAFGRSPLAQIQQWRMQTAIHLLATTSTSVEQAALDVGYASATVLRTLVRRRLGIGLRADPSN